MSKDKLSAKEREILAQQKKLASRLGMTASNGTASSGSAISANSGRPKKRPPPPPPPPPPRTKPVVVDLTGSSPMHNDKKKPPPPPPQKRPTLKKRRGPSPIAVASPDTTALKVERKKKEPTGALAKLVQHVAVPTSGDTTHRPSIQPDDFWKYLREWDFCAQWGQVMGPNPKHSSSTSTRKPLPDLFANAQHYVSLWAPLCVAECKAQLIQEAASNMTTPLAVTTAVGSGPRLSRHAVVDRMMLLDDHHETGTYVTVAPQERGAGNNLNFMAHDICLLLTRAHRDLLRDLRVGTVTNPPKTAALIGHVEKGCKGVKGLVLKVSKRKWAVMDNTKHMYLVKLGCNITALREFTALCRMDRLPLQKYLLGQHLEGDKPRKLSRYQSRQQLLDQMGGRALGDGFLKYARSKFNTSQLTAIAASAHEYGEGGFTLIKGPPGTGKTTTLVAVLNSLHIRQYNKYYDEVRRIATDTRGGRTNALEMARKSKPRLLVCAPSNAAVDNIILKIMEDGFIDGQGNRYNPSMIRVGTGHSSAVRAVSLDTKVDTILEDHSDLGRLDSSINGYKHELQRISMDIADLRRKLQLIKSACAWPLSKDWEIRIDDSEATERAYFVNHREKVTTYEVPPPPEPDEDQFPATSMPEYRSYVSRVVKLVESFFTVKTHMERCTIIQGGAQHGANQMDVRMNLESDVLNSVHIVLTTLGSAGNRSLEGVDKFEVVVVDEAAQSVEPATLSALQLGSRHCVLVGDPQQLPATIFDVSGRNTKYDRSLFQRLEEAGQPVYMLNEQYRMHPKISHFPRHIFYGGNLLDGVNVRDPKYGSPLIETVCRSVAMFQPFTILNLDSKEEKVGTSLSNPSEARLAVFLFEQLKQFSRGLSIKSRVAVITPYAQQSRLLQKTFSDSIGPDYDKMVEVNTVDAFQGREASIVIFSAVRASGSSGIGFLADVRRMNVALTRAKHFLFVIAHIDSIVQNPYWNELVEHARETGAVVHVNAIRLRGILDFGLVSSWQAEKPDPHARRKPSLVADSQQSALMDPRKKSPPRPSDPRK